MATCPVNSSLGVCDILDESGIGLGNFLENIRSPVVKIIAVLAIVIAIIGFVVAISGGFKNLFAKRLR